MTQIFERDRLTNVGGVDVVHWNPRRPVAPGKIGRILPVRRRVNNFGDLLGPSVVRAMTSGSVGGAQSSSRLLTIGSIMHFARDGDVVWGTGVNGKIPLSEISARRLDVRAVRGPRTAAALQGLGVEVPHVFGDPGLLAPELMGIGRAPKTERSIAVIPNMHDERRWRAAPGFMSPRNDPRAVIRFISGAELVVASSLHGLVIADALGIPASILRPGKEDLFKYRDYYEGTGRELPPVGETIDQARNNPAPPAVWDRSALLEAFPADLWRGI